MSLSAPFIPIAFKGALDQTEPYWDYIIGNESEAQSWAQAHNIEVIFTPQLVPSIIHIPPAKLT